MLFRPHFKDSEDTVSEIRKRFNLLSLIEIFKFNLMCVYFDIRNKVILPEITFPVKRSNYRTRNCDELQVPFPRTDAIKISFLYQIPIIWNSIPDVVKLAPYKAIFKSRYKKFLLASDNNLSWWIFSLVWSISISTFINHHEFTIIHPMNWCVDEYYSSAL